MLRVSSQEMTATVRRFTRSAPIRKPSAGVPAHERPSFAQRTSAIDDPRGPMGIRLVVQKRGEQARLSVSQPTLLLPIDKAVVNVMRPSLPVSLDESTWLLLPRGFSAALIAKSVVAKTVVLTLSRALLERVSETYSGEIDPALFERYVKVPHVLVRTTWVSEVCHRYVFERAVCRKRDNAATAFLETELAKELYFLCHERQRRFERPSLIAGQTAVMRQALQYVEEHLFDPDVVSELPRASGASPSTMLRAFKREVGEAPLAYVRMRRLDEALLLLKSRHLRVSEVASLVGYKNPAAFSHAFHQRFGVRAADVLARY
jgi:AraC-like DNA-binding protein